MLTEFLAWVRSVLLGGGSSVRDPLTIQGHESPVRKMVADAHGRPYEPLKTLADARAAPDGAVILEGDWGGQIYLTSPARPIECDERTLLTLLHDLDRIAWPTNVGDGSGLYFEHQGIGSEVAGGMGGAAVQADVWIHEEFVELGLSEAIRDVLGGRGERIPSPRE